MKRINYLLIVLSLLSVMACAGNDKITSDTNILPVSSRQFISDHFKDIPVSHIQIEKNLIRISSYDVILTDGTNVEFTIKENGKRLNGMAPYPASDHSGGNTRPYQEKLFSNKGC